MGSPKKGNELYRPDNFWMNGDSNEKGCWEWQGARSNGNYGHLKVDGTTQYVHHYAWYLTHGVWPNTDRWNVIGHKCDNKRCYNPAHLELISAAQNCQDAYARGLNPGPKGRRAA
jgi:hypothetical protein